MRRRRTNQKKWNPFKSGVEFEVDRCLKGFAGKGKKKVRHYYESEKLKYVIIKDYIPDFRIELPSGKVFFIECKGYFPYEDRVKMLAVKTTNPGLDIRLFFSQDNTIRKGSKKRYSNWCVENGFQYAVGNLPKDWFL